jgi:hypothetical protein
MSDQETQDWQESVRALAQADFQREAVAGEAETTLADLEERVSALQAEHDTLDPTKDVNRRNEIGNELQGLGEQIDNLRVLLPFVGIPDEELATVVEDRQIEAEELALKIKQANDPRFLTSPTRVARLERQHEVAMRAAAEAEVASKRRQQVHELRAMAERTAQKRAENDAAEANTQERIRYGNDPRLQLAAQHRAAEATREFLDEQRQQALERQAEAQGRVGEPE